MNNIIKIACSFGIAITASFGSNHLLNQPAGTTTYDEATDKGKGTEQRVYSIEEMLRQRNKASPFSREEFTDKLREGNPNISEEALRSLVKKLYRPQP